MGKKQQPTIINPNLELALVPLGDINTDHSYQREHINDPLVLEIAEHFSAAAFGAPVVSRRPDGDIVCMDGQHRILAMRLIHPSDSLIQVLVIEQASVVEEAETFVLVNGRRTKVYTNERFKAQLTAKRPVAQHINDTVNKLGLKLELHKQSISKGILATGTLEEIQIKAKPGEFEAVLRIIRDGFSKKPDGSLNFGVFTHQMLRGVFAFIQRYEGIYEEKQLVSKMRLMGQTKFLENANLYRRAVATNAQGHIPRYLVEVYNSKLPVGSERRLKPFDDMPKRGHKSTHEVAVERVKK